MEISQLLDLPAYAVAELHNAGRAPGADAKLYKVNLSLRASRPARGLAVFAPITQAYLPVPRAVYTARFNALLPAVAFAILAQGGKVVVAGGAALWPLGGDTSNPPSDVDLFYVGGPATQDELWRVARTTIRTIVDAIQGLTYIHESLFKGVYTARIRYGPMRTLKVQFILRAFPSLGAMLHGFDVPSAMIAYDGHVAVTTPLGAYALAHRINVVVPAYSSATFGVRLGKYFARGYALGFLDIDVQAFRSHKKIELPDLHLRVMACGREAWACGTITATRGADLLSDNYEFARSILAPDAHNLHQLALGHSRFAAGSKYLSTGNVLLIEAPPHTLSGLIRRDDLVKHRNSVTGESHMTKWLRTYVRSKCAGTPEITELENLNEFKKAATAHIDGLIAALDARRDEPINWWIVDDASSQRTAAFDPRGVSAETWYGPWHRAAPAVVVRCCVKSDAVPRPPKAEAPCQICKNGIYPGEIGAVRGATRDVVCHWLPFGPCPGLRAIEWSTSARMLAAPTRLERAKSWLASPPSCCRENITCCICLDAIAADKSNSVEFQCGHFVHWGVTRECGGMLKFGTIRLSESKVGAHEPINTRQCPYCRA